MKFASISKMRFSFGSKTHLGHVHKSVAMLVYEHRKKRLYNTHEWKKGRKNQFPIVFPMGERLNFIVSIEVADTIKECIFYAEGALGGVEKVKLNPRAGKRNYNLIFNTKKKSNKITNEEIIWNWKVEVIDSKDGGPMPGIYSLGESKHLIYSTFGMSLNPFEQFVCLELVEFGVKWSIGFKMAEVPLAIEKVFHGIKIIPNNFSVQMGLNDYSKRLNNDSYRLNLFGFLEGLKNNQTLKVECYECDFFSLLVLRSIGIPGTVKRIKPKKGRICTQHIELIGNKLKLKNNRKPHRYSIQQLLTQNIIGTKQECWRTHTVLMLNVSGSSLCFDPFVNFLTIQNGINTRVLPLGISLGKYKKKLFQNHRNCFTNSKCCDPNDWKESSISTFSLENRVIQKFVKNARNKDSVAIKDYFAPFSPGSEFPEFEVEIYLNQPFSGLNFFLFHKISQQKEVAIINQQQFDSQNLAKSWIQEKIKTSNLDFVKADTISEWTASSFMVVIKLEGSNNNIVTIIQKTIEPNDPGDLPKRIESVAGRFCEITDKLSIERSNLSDKKSLDAAAIDFTVREYNPRGFQNKGMKLFEIQSELESEILGINWYSNTGNMVKKGKFDCLYLPDSILPPKKVIVEAGIFYKENPAKEVKFILDEI